MELKELGQLLKEYNSRVYRIRRLTMAKKFLKLDGDKLSQVLEFKDGQRIEVPLNMDGSIRWYKDKMKQNAQLEALLNAIPMEITFVDEDNINRYFNEGSKVFKRPVMAIDREVFSCHPPKIEAKVRRIIEEFRIGTLDEVPVWMDKQGRTMLVKYIAVRDKQGNYVGTLEVVQDMEFAKEHFAKLK